MKNMCWLVWFMMIYGLSWKISMRIYGKIDGTWTTFVPSFMVKGQMFFYFTIVKNIECVMMMILQIDEEYILWNRHVSVKVMIIIIILNMEPCTCVVFCCVSVGLTRSALIWFSYTFLFFCLNLNSKFIYYFFVLEIDLSDFKDEIELK
jgi:hypothetical protein